jgi:hypothetical protein
MELYEYIFDRPDFEFFPEETHTAGRQERLLLGSHKKFVLKFRSPFKTDSKRNDTVYSELFLKEDSLSKGPANTTHPRQIRDPLLILVHGFGTNNHKLKNYYKFMGKMLQNDISCLFINLPFHLKRTPEGEKSGERMILFDDMQTLEFFNQAVLDIRKAAVILSDLLSPPSINICGISLGSMIATIAKSFDNNISKAVLVIGGGNWNQIHWNGFMRFVLKGNCLDGGKITKERCASYYQGFEGFVSELKKTGPKKIDSELDGHPGLKDVCSKYCFLCDPVAFAHRINAEDVLMINAKFDHVFSRSSTNHLWEELSRPKICWLNYIHKTDIINRLVSLKNIISFLKND